MSDDLIPVPEAFHPLSSYTVHAITQAKFDRNGDLDLTFKIPAEHAFEAHKLYRNRGFVMHAVIYGLPMGEFILDDSDGDE
jgi:hypothetical protein